MIQKNKNTIRNFWSSFYVSFLPTKRDNISQSVLKILFLFGLISIFAFFCFVSFYFTNINSEQKLLTDNKKIFEKYNADKSGHYSEGLKYFKNQNSDLKGWITIENSDLSAPIYQTNDNDFYKNHNQLKEPSESGILFFDFLETFSKNDKNLVIYGNDQKQLFSCLKNYKSIYYYLKNPIIKFSNLNSTDEYIIFSTFIINTNLKDDNNYIFNYKKSNFKNETEFNNWYNEIKKRSLYLTNIPITEEDDFISLVTDSTEFDGAKLVVMARKFKGKDNIVNINAEINKVPCYPQTYYDKKGIKNPFNKEK